MQCHSNRDFSFALHDKVDRHRWIVCFCSRISKDMIYLSSIDRLHLNLNVVVTRAASIHSLQRHSIIRHTEQRPILRRMRPKHNSIMLLNKLFIIIIFSSWRRWFLWDHHAGERNECKSRMKKKEKTQVCNKWWWQRPMDHTTSFKSTDKHAHVFQETKKERRENPIRSIYWNFAIIFCVCNVLTVDMWALDFCRGAVRSVLPTD